MSFVGAEGRRAALVTGATGAIGPTLVEALLKDGYSVRALVRRPAAQEMLPPAVKTLVGDISDRRALIRAVDGIDIVFHLAAKLHLDMRAADRTAREDYERMNVDATRNLAEVSAEASVRRFVYFSTIAVYGLSRNDEMLDETSPPRPSSVYAETKLRGEEAAIHGMGAVVLRLAAVYGRRVRGNYRRLVRSIQRGTFLRVGSGTNRRTLVHEHDVARAAILAAQHAASGCIYNVTDGHVHTVRDILDAISAALGRRLLPGHLPIAPIRFFIGMVEDTARLSGRTSPIGRGTLDKLLEDVAVSGDRIQADLGFRPVLDLAAGWREALSDPPSTRRQAARGTAGTC